MKIGVIANLVVSRIIFEIFNIRIFNMNMRMNKNWDVHVLYAVETHDLHFKF